jgi:Flp pilus assembly protein TadD
MHILFVLAAAALVAGTAAPAGAEQAEIGYPKGSLAYKAIVTADYVRAESQLNKEVRIPRDDPARLINHGQVLAKTGRLAEAATLFRKALAADEIELILADGRVMSSREAARRALESVSVGGPGEER